MGNKSSTLPPKYDDIVSSNNFKTESPSIIEEAKQLKARKEKEEENAKVIARGKNFLQLVADMDKYMTYMNYSIKKDISTLFKTMPEIISKYIDMNDHFAYATLIEFPTFDYHDNAGYWDKDDAGFPKNIDSIMINKLHIAVLDEIITHLNDAKYNDIKIEVSFHKSDMPDGRCIPHDSKKGVECLKNKCDLRRVYLFKINICSKV